MTGPPQSTMARLRDRDGDGCWLCGSKVDFAAPANSKKAPTREHLVALSQGGTSTLDNLVLCHPGCNRQLGDRPIADKLKMRNKRIANRAKQLAGAKAAKQKALSNEASPIKQPGLAKPKAIAQPVQANKRPTVRVAPGPPHARWMRIAFMASGTSLFLAGLVAGLLIR